MSSSSATVSGAKRRASGDNATAGPAPKVALCEIYDEDEEVLADAMEEQENLARSLIANSESLAIVPANPTQMNTYQRPLSIQIPLARKNLMTACDLFGNYNASTGMFSFYSKFGLPAFPIDPANLTVPNIISQYAQIINPMLNKCYGLSEITCQENSNYCIVNTIAGEERLNFTETLFCTLCPTPENKTTTSNQEILTYLLRDGYFRLYLHQMDMRIVTRRIRMSAAASTNVFVIGSNYDVKLSSRPIKEVITDKSLRPLCVTFTINYLTTYLPPPDPKKPGDCPKTCCLVFADVLAMAVVKNEL